jgi:hypothetical protein
MGVSWPLLGWASLNSGIPFSCTRWRPGAAIGYSAIFNATTPLVATVVGALVFAEAITPACGWCAGDWRRGGAGPGRATGSQHSVLGGMAACFVATVMRFPAI